MPEEFQSNLVALYRPSGRERCNEGNFDTGSTSQPEGRTTLKKKSSRTIFQRFSQYVSAFFKLGRMYRMIKSNSEMVASYNTQFNQIQTLVDEIRHQQESIFHGHSERLVQQRDELQKLNSMLASQSTFNLELSRRFDSFLYHKIIQNTESQSIFNPDADQTSRFQHKEALKIFMDVFYTNLETRYRGSCQDVSKKLHPYLSYARAAYVRTGGKAALDLGCGRGEWLTMLKEHDIPASGVDLSSGQLAQARENDLDVREQDVLTALEATPDDSLSLITAFHLVEHLPFEDVAWIVREAQRVLAPGGVLIFETPNPHNLIVGATSFHNDPTHRSPLTHPVLSVLFETAGYSSCEVLFLNPHERLNEFLTKPNFDHEIAYLLFGAQDFAIIGQKHDRETV